MLNISNNRIAGRLKTEKYKAFSLTKDSKTGSILARLIGGSMFAFILILLLPWTQNIRAKGYVTTLRPDQRPQTIHSVIGGRIEKWFVKEGQRVSKGDTILFLSEVKDAYFDPRLLERTEAQIKAKEQSQNSYSGKADALARQMDALIRTRDLKEEQATNYIRQANLKVASDSIDLEAAITQYEIALQQYDRMEKMYAEGISPLTDLESRRIKVREATAKKISAENKLLASRNELINAKVELVSIRNQYQDKFAKAESERFSALSGMFDAEATVSKMENQLSNYSVRTGLYYVIAPQDGFITKAIKTGIGETLKEGEPLLSIMPANFELAVEMYVKPVDLPLLSPGEKVRFIFDGWPSIVFSGWPNASFGTFGGKVVAIDNFTSDNGKYRVLVGQDPDDVAWPNGLRPGSGAVGMSLLNDVPIWYELWRQLNGFPPDFYSPEESGSASGTAEGSEMKKKK